MCVLNGFDQNLNIIQLELLMSDWFWGTFVITEMKNVSVLDCSDKHVEIAKIKTVNISLVWVTLVNIKNWECVHFEWL